MSKVDFSLLLEPIASTSTLKDVATVDGIYSVSEQIKNCLFTTPEDRPFSKFGIDSSKKNLYNDFDRTMYVVKLKNKLLATNRYIQNLSIKHYTQGNYLKLVLTFDYVVGSQKTANNIVTVEKKII